MSNARNLANLLGTGATIATAAIADDAITSAKLDTNIAVDGSITAGTELVGDVSSRIIMDSSAADTDVGDNLLLNATDGSASDDGSNFIYNEVVANNDALVSGIPNLVGGLTYNNGSALGNLRIQTGTSTTPSSSTDAGTNEGNGARYYNNTTIALNGFASAPTVFASVLSSNHEATCSPVKSVSATSAVFTTHGARTAGIQGRVFHFIAIGEAL